MKSKKPIETKPKKKRVTHDNGRAKRKLFARDVVSLGRRIGADAGRYVTTLPIRDRALLAEVLRTLATFVERGP